MAKSLCEAVTSYEGKPATNFAKPSWRSAKDCGDVSQSASWDASGLTRGVADRKQRPDRKTLQFAEPKVQKVPAKRLPDLV